MNPSSQAGLAISLPLSLGLAAFGSAIGMGLAIASALQGMARQPEAAGKIFINMLVGCALIESLTIYTLIVLFMYIGKIG
ncbi:ATP synthase subunit c [Gammaproteobacteria bacterium]